MDNELRIATNRLHGLIEGFAEKRVLVIGDMVADEYLVGRPTRIARDAPVMILELYEERTVPGEAANVAVNARSLGAEVFLAGVVGDDVPGQRLRKAIDELGIHQDGLVSDTRRPTSTKQRIVAGSSQMVQRQIVRIDRVDNSELEDGSRGRLSDYIQRVLPSMDAVVLADYENGVISPQILENCLPLARKLGKITVADAHGSLVPFPGCDGDHAKSAGGGIDAGSEHFYDGGIERGGTAPAGWQPGKEHSDYTRRGGYESV